MARVNIGGFEAGQNTGGAVSLEAGMGSANGGSSADAGGTVSVQSTVKRTGTYALRVNPTTTALGWVGVRTPNNTNLTGTPYLRFYFRYATKPGSGHEEIMSWFQGSSDEVGSVGLNSSGNLVVAVNGTVGATGSAVLTGDTWYMIEVLCGNPTVVKVDGTQDISHSSGSLGTAIKYFLGKHINRNSQTIDFFYDDVAVDDAGYPGAGEVKLIKANGNGNYTAWTNDSASVDEAPPIDDDTTFISTSTNLNAETAAMESSATGGISGTINAVKTNPICRTANTVGLQARLRSGSADNDSATVSFATSTIWHGLGKIYNTDPADAAAWTTTKIDALECGVEHNQSQAREARCTAIYVMVEYTPAGGATEAAGTLTGTSSVSGVGQTQAKSAGTSTGVATVSGVGRAQAKSAGTSTAAATVSGVGEIGRAHV